MSIAPNGDGFILDDAGFAVPRADVLSDFFAEHSDDPDEGPPESWPAWTDEITLEPGPALTPDEVIPDDLVEPDLALLRQVERTDWERWLAGPAESQP